MQFDKLSWRTFQKFMLNPLDFNDGGKKLPKKKKTALLDRGCNCQALGKEEDSRED